MSDIDLFMNINNCFTKVTITSTCWIWNKSLHDGYGRFRLVKSSKRIFAHRFTYLLFKGDIPKGYEIDHLCRNRACVNPDHLELVTKIINIRRGRSACREKTHCPKGHQYTEDNIVKWDLEHTHKRVCIKCRNVIQNKGYAKRKQRNLKI